MNEVMIRSQLMTITADQNYDFKQGGTLAIDQNVTLASHDDMAIPTCDSEDLKSRNHKVFRLLAI